MINDEMHNGDVRAVTENERDSVMDGCLKCKLCEVQCPYTPREGHEFKLDFPKLVHRYQALRHRKHGGTLRDKVLGDPDLAGRLARASFGLANTMNRVRPPLFSWTRYCIHPAHLPDFASATSRLAEKRANGRESGCRGGVFQTCFCAE